MHSMPTQIAMISCNKATMRGSNPTGSLQLTAAIQDAYLGQQRPETSKEAAVAAKAQGWQA